MRHGRGRHSSPPPDIVVIYSGHKVINPPSSSISFSYTLFWYTIPIPIYSLIRSKVFTFDLYRCCIHGHYKKKNKKNQEIHFITMAFVTWRRETFPHLPSLCIRTESQKSSSSSQFNTRGFHNCVNSLMKHYKLQHPGKTRILTPPHICVRGKSQESSVLTKE